MKEKDMSRIIYNECMDNRELGLQMGRDAQAIRGKRGQAFLRELEAALLSLTPRRLIVDVLCDQQGEVCALGAVARKRLVTQGATYAEAELALCPDNDPEPYFWEDPDDDTTEYAVKVLGLSATMAWLIQEANDDPEGPSRTPEQRYDYVLGQVRRMLEGKLPVDRLP